MTRRSAAALMGVASVVLVSCSSSGKGTDVTSHLTYTQAQAQVHVYLTQSLHALPAGATLSTALPDNPVPCSDDDGAPASTPVSINASSWVGGLPQAGLSQHLESFVKYWQGQGWTVSADKRPADQFVALRSPDGYAVVMQLTSTGNRASISGSTPCVPPKAAT